MTNTTRRKLSGLINGAFGLATLGATAQEPQAPAKPDTPPKAEAGAEAGPVPVDPFKAPDNVAAAPDGAEKTDSGLASVVLEKGTGTVKPKPTDTVRVHYTGWKAADGEKFDSSVERGRPAEFAVEGVIPGWTEGLQLMVAGEKRRLWIPVDLAYKGQPGYPEGNLTFDVELLEVVSAPENLKAPEGAIAQDSGLKSEILKEGTGDATPNEDNLVTFEFSGWKADGEYIGSSYAQPRSVQTPMAELTIEGWSEGIQLMKKGEKRRLWIPADLAFGEEGKAQGGAPAGDLIFEIELIDFRDMPKPPPRPKDPSAPEDVAAAPEGAAKTESGIAYKTITEGEGEATPAKDDWVVVHFAGWTSEGSTVGSSKSPDGKQGDPMTFSFEKSPFESWNEILLGMKKGEKRRSWIPKSLVPAGLKRQGDLTFDLELVDFRKPIPAPADVAAIPDDATTLESGLAFKVLKEGTGTRKAVASDQVKVDYTGWTIDGKMFDSSIIRGKKAEFPLNQVIPGWTQGVQLMVEGEKRRFWIPVDLAYNGQPGKPEGMLVFDIELFENMTPETKKIEAVTPPIEIKPPNPEEKGPE